MRNVLVVVSLALALTAAAEVNPTATFVVYPLHQADPGSTEQAVRQLVGEGGSVVLDAKHHRLLVLAMPPEHERIQSLMDQLAVPFRNVRIDVSFIGGGQQRDAGFAIHGSGEVVITDDDANGSFRIQPEIRNVLTETSRNTKQTLLVGSGKQGTLMVGKEMPYIDWMVEYGRRWGYIEGHAKWHQVGARLLVQPTVLGDGDMVHVRVVPEISGTVNHQPFHVEFARAATEVTVPNGSTIRLGGLQKDESFYSRFLIGQTSSGLREQLDIELTPHIMPLPNK
jgi:type II secretory pathway component GspD/PulD (secretin)